MSWIRNNASQVFHSLLKAHAVEARGVVRQALEILTPSMPGRMEDGNTMLTHWTKKIIVEDGHTGSQLVHILQLVVKHHKAGLEKTRVFKKKTSPVGFFRFFWVFWFFFGVF
jgi:hypothetical protein